jgi:aryl-alcohol dehydrogenase-like predicted oxidoreductase
MAIHYLEENAAAIEVELSDERLHELDELFAPGETAGDRYLPDGMARVEL